jgi:hypothetical protein
MMEDHHDHHHLPLRDPRPSVRKCTADDGLFMRPSTAADCARVSVRGAERRCVEGTRPGSGGGSLAVSMCAGPGAREGTVPNAGGFEGRRRAGRIHGVALRAAFVCSILVCTEGGRAGVSAMATGGQAHSRFAGPTRLRGGNGGDDDPVKAARAGTRGCASPSLDVQVRLR